MAEGKIRHIFVYPQYLIVLKTNSAILKLDINNGAVLGQLKSTTIEQLYNLNSLFVFIDAVAGKPSVLNVGNMSIIKKYSPKVVNPLGCYSSVIRDATLQENVLTISGFEQEQFNRTFNVSNQKPFSKIIDPEMLSH